MHNHYCWGFVSKNMRHHDVDPDVAVLQHYKRCHFSASECQLMMNDTSIDNTTLKYRAELAKVVSQKLARLGYL